MGEVIDLRAYRIARNGDMTLEQARRLCGFIDWKIANKRAMDERDRLGATANGEACAMKRDSVSQTLKPNRKQVETESDMR